MRSFDLVPTIEERAGYVGANHTNGRRAGCGRQFHVRGYLLSFVSTGDDYNDFDVDLAGTEEQKGRSVESKDGRRGNTNVRNIEVNLNSYLRLFRLSANINLSNLPLSTYHLLYSLKL